LGGTDENISNPEEALNFELGAKTLQLDRRLRLNANLYLTTVSDFQTRIRTEDPISPGTFTTIDGNVEEIVSRGLEFDGAYAITRNFNFNFSGAYNDAYYESFENAPLPPEADPASAPFLDYSGRQLPGASKYSFSVGFDGRYYLSTRNYLYGSINTTYRSEYNASQTLSIYGVQDAFTLTDLTIGLSTRDGNYDVSFVAKNLFDKVYKTTAGDGSTTASLSTESIGPRRFLGVVFRARL
jgi:iron complex outermembrane recepter protein